MVYVKMTGLTPSRMDSDSAKIRSIDDGWMTGEMKERSGFKSKTRQEGKTWSEWFRSVSLTNFISQGMNCEEFQGWYFEQRRMKEKFTCCWTLVGIIMQTFQNKILRTPPMVSERKGEESMNLLVAQDCRGFQLLHSQLRSLLHVYHRYHRDRYWSSRIARINDRSFACASFDSYLQCHHTQRIDIDRCCYLTQF